MDIIMPKLTKAEIIKNCQDVINKWYSSDDYKKRQKLEEKGKFITVILAETLIGIAIGSLLRITIIKEKLYLYWIIVASLFIFCMAFGLFYAIKDCSYYSKESELAKSVSLDYMPNSDSVDSIRSALRGYNLTSLFDLEKYRELGATFTINGTSHIGDTYYVHLKAYINDYYVDDISFQGDITVFKNMTKKKNIIDLSTVVFERSKLL